MPSQERSADGSNFTRCQLAQAPYFYNKLTNTRNFGIKIGLFACRNRLHSTDLPQHAMTMIITRPLQAGACGRWSRAAFAVGVSNSYGNGNGSVWRAGIRQLPIPATTLRSHTQTRHLGLKSLLSLKLWVPVSTLKLARLYSTSQQPDEPPR